MASLSLSGVTKKYGRQEVIHGVDLDVKDGEFVSLIGSSGCGKSTLLRMIAGLEEVTSGTVSVDGRVVNDVEPKDRDMAMVFQNYALYPHLTVAENMGFSLHLRNVPKAEAEVSVRKAADLLGLSPYLSRLPKQLSGGQRQRVAMGRAIVRDPHVFLFDEPLSNLDAKLRVQMRLEIKALQKRLGTTSVYVTHDQVEALTMSDRLVLLNEGRVAQIGTPMEVYSRPANIFVATFIGSPAMNLFDGHIVRSGDLAFAQVNGVRLAIPGAIALPDDTPIKLGIRPEHLRVAANGPLTMAIAAVETTGSIAYAYGSFGAEPMTVMFDGKNCPTAGTQITLTPDDDALHVFAAATGERAN